MTRLSRTHLYRQIAVAFFAGAVTASALPAHAQYYRHDGYHGRPAPQYRGHGYRDRGDGGGVDVLGGIDDHAAKEFFLAAEVVVDRRFRDPRFRGDQIDTGALVPLACEHAVGGIQDRSSFVETSS